MAFIATFGKILIGAAAIGGAVGYCSIAATAEGQGQISTQLADLAHGAGEAAVETGELVNDIAETRDRPPQPGDIWGGCNDARDAGTAPIYSGEPGYRSDMDGDNDGIACEPHY